MKLLNLGCGSRYHDAWTNIDFVSSRINVIGHNLLKGIPYPDNSFDVAYHSHVLEHFSKSDGRNFIKECFRVLRPNGVIRIAVPDLERIAEEYLKNLRLAAQGDVYAEGNYEWIKLELFDQAVRNEIGGDMAKYMFRDEIPNEEYIYERIGEEARSLRRAYFQSRQQSEELKRIPLKRSRINQILSNFKKIAHRLKGVLLSANLKYPENVQKQISIGKFRLGGEVHQWMYDRFSLSKLLSEVGFIEIEIKDAFTSKVPSWNCYELESKNGIIYKPDSLFIEAVKG